MTEKEFINAFDLGKRIHGHVKMVGGKLIYPLIQNDKSLVIRLPKFTLRFRWLRNIDELARDCGWTIDYLEAVMRYDKGHCVFVKDGYKIWMRVI